jgi:hypothetical protein
MAISLSNLMALALADHFDTVVNTGAGANGFIRIYDDTSGVPSEADASVGSAVLLATVNTQEPAFGAAADAAPGATITLAGVPLSDLSIDATGTAAFFRMYDQDSNVVLQGTVGTSGTDMIVNSVAFQSGATFSILSMTVTMPES